MRLGLPKFFNVHEEIYPEGLVDFHDVIIIMTWFAMMHIGMHDY